MGDASMRAKNNALRLLASCGIIGPIFFTTVVIILGAIRPGYSHVAQAISELGEVGAPNAIIQDINFVVYGVLILAFALGLHRGISGGKGSRIGPSLVAFSSVVAFTLGGGFFPCDPGCNFVTIRGTLHNVFGLTGFVAIIGAALILPRRLKTDSQWQSYRSYSLVTGLLTTVFLVAFIGSSAGLFLLGYRGAIQRLMVGTFLLWTEVMAIKLFKISSSSEGAMNVD
jgi:hypothetical membrane protein